MIETCKECGKQYSIDSSKLKNKVTGFNCHACGNKIIVTQSKVKKKEESPKAKKRRVFGLKGKIFTIFFVIPIALIITAGYLFVDQLNGLSIIIGHESSNMVTQMAEEIILDKGTAVAREVKLYLDTHPDLKKEDFNKTPEFLDVAVQKVGETGYTVIVERETADHPEYLWVHPNEKLIGIDITNAVKSKLGDKWEAWSKVRAKSHITKGYYLWIDNREKYLCNIPIEGTPFNVASATYMDEFTQPVKNLQVKMIDITGSTRKIVLGIIAITALLVAVITIFYGHKLTSKIISLINVADRISLGDLNASIDDTGKDELGDLAQAIQRMQYSIRMAIKKLRPDPSHQTR